MKTKTNDSPAVKRAQALRFLRRYVESRDAGDSFFRHVKAAETGESQEGAFEQAFATLAHTYLADAAPKLLDYELGFQLLEKNEEGSRSVGVFGFKAADQIMFAPVFFLNGSLKGHELLYLKKQDLFVPLKEDWVNYLLGRKTVSIGKSVDRNLSRLGVTGPSFYQITRPPYKHASASDSGWGRAAAREMVAAARSKPSLSSGVKGWSLAGMIKESRAAFDGLLQLAAARPSFYHDLEKFHPGLLKSAAAHHVKMASVPPPKRSKLAFDASSTSASSPTERAAMRSWTAGETPKDHLARIRVMGNSQGSEAYDSVLPYMNDRALDRRSRARKQDAAATGRPSLLDVMSGGVKKQQTRTGSPVSAVKMAADDSSSGKVKATGGADVRDLTGKEKEYLLTNRYVIRDERQGFAEFSHAYDVNTPMSLHNPDQTGLFQVLIGPDKFKTCLVAMRPWSNKGARDFCCVVDLETKKWTNIHPSRVWVKSEGGTEHFNKWFDGLGGPNFSLSLPTENEEEEKEEEEKEEHGWFSGPRMLLLTRQGNATTPFRVRSRSGGEDGNSKNFSQVWGVWFDDHCRTGEDTPYQTAGEREAIRRRISSLSWPERSDLRFTGKAGAKMTLHEDGEIWLPAEVKALTLKRPSSEAGRDHDEHDVLRPGSLADVQEWLSGRTFPLRAHVDGKDYSLSSKRMRGFDTGEKAKGDTQKKEASADCDWTVVHLDKPSAVIELVVGAGLSEADALCLLNKAERRKSAGCLVLPAPGHEGYFLHRGLLSVKEAADPSDLQTLVRSAPNAPGFPELPTSASNPLTGGKYPATLSTEWQMPVADLVASRTASNARFNNDPRIEPDHIALRAVGEAAKTGDKDIFDTAVLGGLLHTTKDEGLIDRNLPSLMKGTDGLGRILFNYYWHQDQFADRYGKSDLSEIEDGLRNAFESIGAITLKLKARKVDSLLSEGVGNDDLEDVASVV